MAVTFLESQHVVKPNQFNFAKPEEIESSPGQKRTIYLTFGDENSVRAVWHNIVNDSRPVRS